MASIEAVAEKKYRSEQVERELVAYILKKQPTMAAKLKPGWFASSILGNIVKVQRDIRATVTKAALITELRSRKIIGKGESALYESELDEVYRIPVNKMNDRSAEVNLRHIIEMYEGRTILYGMREIAENVSRFSVEEMKTKMKELGTGVMFREEIISGSYVAGLDLRREAILEKQRLRAEGKDVGMPTGISAFDHMIGGLMRAEFGVIAGQPGVGKSATLVSFALHAWRSGHNVLFVTGEMPKLDIEFRMDSDVAGIPAQKFRFGTLTNNDMSKWEAAIKKEAAVRENYLEVVSFPRNFTATDIESHAIQIQEQYESPIELICIDYLNIMNAVGSKLSSKEWQAQADVVWDVKSMCADLNGGVFVWTAGQVKDEAIDEPMLSLDHLKYARAISETAPVVIGLVRSQDDEAESVLELQVLKMRNAPLPTRSIILRPNLEYMRIHEEVAPTIKDFTLFETETKKMPIRKKKEYK